MKRRSKARRRAQIIEAAETLPFMCERRLVIVRDWAPLLSGKSRDEEGETARVLDWLKALRPQAASWSSPCGGRRTGAKG